MKVGWKLDESWMKVGWKLDEGWMKVGWKLDESWMKLPILHTVVRRMDIIVFYFTLTLPLLRNSTEVVFSTGYAVHGRSVARYLESIQYRNEGIFSTLGRKNSGNYPSNFHYFHPRLTDSDPHETETGKNSNDFFPHFLISPCRSH